MKTLILNLLFFVLASPNLFAADPTPPAGAAGSVQIPTDLRATQIYQSSELGLIDETKVGRKAASYAELANALNTPSQVIVRNAYILPFSYYQDYLNTNVRLGQLLDEVLKDPKMNVESESVYRAQQLKRVQDLMRSEENYVNDQLVDSLIAFFDRERAWSGLPKKMELRASSNAEALPQFRGLALYDSSFYNPVTDKNMEASPSKKRQELKQALRRIWSSTWSYRAYEERRKGAVPQDQVKMGVLISAAFSDDLASGIAVTQNLTQNAGMSGPAISIEAQRGSTFNVLRPVQGVKASRVLVLYPENQPMNDSAYDIQQVQTSNVDNSTRQFLKTDNPEPVLTRELTVSLTHLLLRSRNHFRYVMQGGQDFAVALEFRVSADDTGSPAIYLKQVRPYTIRTQ